MGLDASRCFVFTVTVDPTPSYFLKVIPLTAPPGIEAKVLFFYNRAATPIPKCYFFTIGTEPFPSASVRFRALPFTSVHFRAAPDQIRRPGKGAIFSDEIQPAPGAQNGHSDCKNTKFYA